MTKGPWNAQRLLLPCPAFCALARHGSALCSDLQVLVRLMTLLASLNLELRRGAILISTEGANILQIAIGADGACGRWGSCRR